MEFIVGREYIFDITRAEKLCDAIYVMKVVKKDKTHVHFLFRRYRETTKSSDCVYRGPVMYLHKDLNRYINNPECTIKPLDTDILPKELFEL